AEVRADALQAVVLDDLARLLAVGEALELGVARRGAQCDLPDPGRLHVLQQLDELAVGDLLALRIGLTAKRQTERVRPKLRACCHHDASRGRAPAGLVEELT